MSFHRPNHSILLAALTATIFAHQSRIARADLLVSTYDDSSVERFDEATHVPTPAGNIPSGANGLTVAQGVAVGPDHTIYVSSAFTGKVQRYDSGGSFLGDFPTLADPTPLVAPSTLKFGPNGNLFVADFGGNALLEFDPVGTFVGVAASFDSAPGGFTWAPGGDLIVSELFGSIRQIHEGTPTELVPADIGLTPADLLLLPDGDLLIANLYGNNILRYDSDSGMTTIFAAIDHPIAPGGMFPDPAFPSNGPAAIIFDRDNTLLMAVTGPDHNHTGQIQRFDLDGNYLGSIIIGLGTPTGLALIPEPSAWVLAAIGAAGWGLLVRRRRRGR
jgi:PEP-CTERM motif